MSCRTAQEHRAKLAASVLSDMPCVIHADPLEPNADPTPDWTVELTIDADRCPPQVLGVLHEYGLGTLDQNPQGGLHKVEAVAD